jgi:hypothetical protein
MKLMRPETIFAALLAGSFATAAMAAENGSVFGSLAQPDGGAAAQAARRVIPAPDRTLFTKPVARRASKNGGALDNLVQNLRDQGKINEELSVVVKKSEVNVGKKKTLLGLEHKF